jgi:hypothetical protein
MFGPLNKRKDGTFVFASPIGDGHVPMIALADLGFWARWTFDHRAETSTKDLEVASEIIGWDKLVETFTRVTGQPAVFKRQTLDEWWSNFTAVDKPIANERPDEDGSTTFKQNFSAFWRQWRDDIISRDMEWVRSINTKGYTLERWMKETRYTGTISRGVLKNAEDGKGFGLNLENISKL